MNFFDSISSYFILFNKKLDYKNNWRADINFYKNNIDGLISINLINNKLKEYNNKLIIFINNFKNFYQITIIDLIKLVNEDLDKAVSIVLNINLKPEKIIPLEEIIINLILKDSFNKFIFDQITSFLIKNTENELNNLITNIYKLFYYSILFNKITKM
ncbi:hypothetical protein Mgra_00009298, partial [Meloidogyne graminicola]